MFLTNELLDFIQLIFLTFQKNNNLCLLANISKGLDFQDIDYCIDNCVTSEIPEHSEFIKIVQNALLWVSIHQSLIKFYAILLKFFKPVSLKT